MKRKSEIDRITKETNIKVEIDLNGKISYLTAEEAKKNNYQIMKLSGTEFRKKLRNGDPIPEWFAFKSVVDVLRKS